MNARTWRKHLLHRSAAGLGSTPVRLPRHGSCCSTPRARQESQAERRAGHTAGRSRRDCGAHSLRPSRCQRGHRSGKASWLLPRVEVSSRCLRPSWSRASRVRGAEAAISTEASERLESSADLTLSELMNPGVLVCSLYSFILPGATPCHGAAHEAHLRACAPPHKLNRSAPHAPWVSRLGPGVDAGTKPCNRGALRTLSS